MKFRIKERGKENAWRHKRLTQAVSFYAKTLRIPNPKELDITLKLSYAKKMIAESHRGNCNPALESYINGNLYIFTITMQGGMPWSWTLSTFAHEMVHAHQLATGRLRIAIVDGVWKYSWEQGEWVVPVKLGHSNYSEQPWEKDALSKQDSMRDAFFAIEEATGILPTGY